MKKAEYRNSTRSRKLICNALLELLNEKPLEKITVTDIANRADLNRGTFYLHYDSVNDVVSELQDELITQLDEYFANLEIPISTDNIMPIVAECLKYIFDQNQSKYMALVYHSKLEFVEKFCKSFQMRLLNSPNSPKDKDTIKELVVRAFILAHGIIGVSHAAARGVLDISKESLIRNLDHLTADMKNISPPKN